MPEPKYETVGAHLRGDTLKAFKRLTPNRGDASRFVVSAIERELERLGELTPKPAADLHAELDALLSADPAAASQIESYLTTLARERLATSQA